MMNEMLNAFGGNVGYLVAYEILWGIPFFITCAGAPIVLMILGIKKAKEIENEE